MVVHNVGSMDKHKYKRHVIWGSMGSVGRWVGWISGLVCICNEQWTDISESIGPVHKVQ